MATTDDPVAVLKQGLSRLYKTEKFSDFTIVCGPQTFRVHKAVLCAQSEYFHALPKFAEGAKNSIELKAIGSGDGDDEACDEPEAINLMVHFFYHLDYHADALVISPAAKDSTKLLRVNKSSKESFKAALNRNAPPPPQPPRNVCGMHVGMTPAPVAVAGPEAASTATDGNMVMHAKVFAAAVKYQVAGLKSLAATNFSNAVGANWNHDSFAEAAHIVYTTTPEDVRTLRDIITTILTEHGDLLDKPEVETVVRSISGLAYELLKRSRTPAEPTNPCRVCGYSIPKSCPYFAGSGEVNMACYCNRVCKLCGTSCSAARG